MRRTAASQTQPDRSILPRLNERRKTRQRFCRILKSTTGSIAWRCVQASKICPTILIELAYADDEGEHADIARDALRAGDLRRSIYHLALALATNPEREDWLVLLDQWIATADPHALELVPLYDKEYFTTLQASQRMMQMSNKPDHRVEVIPVVGKHYHAKVAVHAFILATQGRIKEGVDLLLQLVQVKLDIPYITWLTLWQNQPGFVDILKPPIRAAV